MENLYAVRAQIRAIGRSALVGTLIGVVSMQAFANGLNDTVKTADRPSNTTATVVQPAQSTPAASSRSSLNGSSSSAVDLSALPSAPEVAKVEASAPIDPMVADAAQQGQSFAPPQSSNKKLQRPGMLVLGIAGLPLIAMGAMFYSLNTKNTSGKIEVGSIFMVPGAAMSGLGFYYAFHKKN